MLKYLRGLLNQTDPDLGAVRAEIDAVLQEPVTKPPPPDPDPHRPTASSTPCSRPAAADAIPEALPDSPAMPGLPADTATEAGFDPYNTGEFDRSRSWEKISKNRSR